MNTRRRTASAALLPLAALLSLALAGCGTETADTAGPSGGKETGSADPGSGPGAGSEKPGEGKARSKPLPELTGKGLQSAQNAAQHAGFYRLASHDALGRERMQVFDRNWKVCSQNPAPGDHPTDVKVELGAVKVAEKCPGKDVAAPSKAGDVMPDFHDKSVKAARAALDPATSLDIKDATRQNRMVLVESNWKICAQTPKAGEQLTGQPVTFRTVKYEENCP